MARALLPWFLLFSGFLNALGQPKVNISPMGKVYKNVGEEFTMLCEVGEKLKSCNITLGGKRYNLHPWTQAGNVTYNGRGLERGQCGVKVSRLEESHNGTVHCAMDVGNASFSMTLKNHLVLIVRHRPELKIISPASINHKFKEGDVLTASCTDVNGLQAGNISWYLGGKKIVDGLSRLSVEKGAWISMERIKEWATVEQTLTRRVEGGDDMKRLQCAASHPPIAPNATYSQPVLLHVQYPPKSSRKSIKVVGLVRGTKVRVVVDVAANPRPEFQWKVGAVAIGEGMERNRFHVEKAKQKHDLWHSVLVIDRFNKEDLSRKYHLFARNSLGNITLPVTFHADPLEEVLMEIAELPVKSIPYFLFVLFLMLVVILAMVVRRAVSKRKW